MTVVITYSFISNLLDSISEENKLSFVDFQMILKYVYLKLDIMEKLKHNKKIIMCDKVILLDVLTRLDLIISQGLIENENLKETMLKLVDDCYGKLNTF
jgi:hypothetical protein